MVANLSYLQQLTIRLAVGVQELPSSVRQAHARFLLASQQADGGFSGRLGESDCYYTSFGLRGLAVLGELYGPVAERAAGFLRTRLTAPESTLDLISLVISAAVLDAAAGLDVTREIPGWRDDVVARLESLRCAEGGYTKSLQGNAASTYQTFLTVVCQQLLGHPIADRAGIVSFIRSQETPSGGFRDIRVVKRAGTNPTAAAVGTLTLLDALDAETAERTARFLAGMQNEEGGLLANSRIPVADVLSTFTGLVTLHDIGVSGAVDRAAARGFLERLQGDTGGFTAAAWDDVCDVEYTFYGLGGLALLAAWMKDERGK